MVEQKFYRVGIDVGGTFTHAVAIDATTRSVVGKAKVPTSHRAKEGVARGIVEALHALLADAAIAPENVNFIAHSTTQATNALLEGDLAKVGIIGMGSGLNKGLAEHSTRLGKIEVAPGCFVDTCYRFIATDSAPSEALIEKTIKDLLAEGAGAIACSEAFSVDGPANEQLVGKVAADLGVLFTAGSEVSQLYGLKVRTRTAVINAGILPKMIESANLTEESVRASGITAPIMIMRSDGGVMDIEAMRKRPILSILSGPAAGVAAAMMFLRISDGIFVEVGGTSTDISAIANGRALIRSAEIGGHRIYMRTLDVRTVGVAGGSMVRLAAGAVKDVGPRSAHIAGLKYSSFEPLEPKPFAVKMVRPLAKDPQDYLALCRPLAEGEESATPSFTLTPTCASNLLGLVPDGDCARGNEATIKEAFETLSRHFAGGGAASADATATSLATSILKSAAKKCIPVIRALIEDHKLDPELTKLVGGGGGAAAIVPFVAREMGLTFELAEHADVISAIGVAMALIRETVERQVANAAQANETILAMRQEVFEAVHQMGADPATIEVHVEIDSKTNIIRATASGASKFYEDASASALSEEARLKLVADSLRTDVSHVSRLCSSKTFEVFSGHDLCAGALKNGQARGRTLAGSVASLLRFEFLHRPASPLRVLDNKGVLRLQARDGTAAVCPVTQVDAVVTRFCEEYSTWGDAGKTIPSFILLVQGKIVDLSGLLDEAQVKALAAAELKEQAADCQVIVVAKFN
ncbi:MAG: hydantoinase [Cyanobacteria bacterium SZAS TMP-1]|nr:hydantoinase [Cyanobacteria bacterium SZAS TMP-1]